MPAPLKNHYASKPAAERADAFLPSVRCRHADRNRIVSAASRSGKKLTAFILAATLAAAGPWPAKK